MRKAGVLMAISSLPSDFGIGDFGPAAFQFVDFLAGAKVSIWQMLPFNRLGYGNSPYQPFSSIAGDELFISIDALVEDGYLKPADITRTKQGATSVAYEEARALKEPYLRKAFTYFKENERLYETEFRQFLEENDWVYEYSVFLALRQANNEECWVDWQPAHRMWITDRKADISVYAEEIAFYQFLQFIFFKQWRRLKAYANAKGIQMMGDIAYYVGLDSLDVWANQSVFLLDEMGHPTHVGGVPPDYFSEEGQLWGCPIYDWDALATDDFRFWIERLRLAGSLFDIVRIDHFRAFDTYWQVPADEETAANGEWAEAPGYAFFDRLFEVLPDVNIIVEDLGEMRPEVFVLRDHYHFMGMEIMHFAFDQNGQPRPEVLAELKNKIIYTGTHDNQTTRGWFSGQPIEKQKGMQAYLRAQGYWGTNAEQLVQYVLGSVSPIAIVPVCDILDLDDAARMNTPGTVGSPNWEWKLADFDLFAEKMEEFSEWMKESGRT